jgi:uncharacterized protein
MQYSKHNIFSKIRDSENYFIVNLLSGNADILDPGEARIVRSLVNQENIFPGNDFMEELANKGYITDEQDELKLYRKKYLDHLDNLDKEEIQLFFVPNYSCNFSCSYCYQDQYENPLNGLSVNIIDAFFEYIRTEFSARNKYITIFGGEPLLNNDRQKGLIEYLISKATLSNIDTCIVTNGYFLSEYTDIIRKGRIREIQVTLDGTREIHNSRRYLKGGGGTFDQIVDGIDMCLENQIQVNLRMVIDKDNAGNLPEFARFAIEKGWTGNDLFKTQLGRNYELHHCQSTSAKLFDRISLYDKVYRIIKEYPFVEKFHKPSYSVSRYLAENGALPYPLFDSCPACKSEWAFDFTGKIYPCTATVGKSGEATGTFFPQKKIDAALVNHWETRDVTSITGCKDCNLQLACGGGCGSIARNLTGKISSPDCRPVSELLELGFSAYLDKEEKK